MASTDRVNIRPGVSILSVLRHLNYRPWFAIAEFVDNALQSFLSNRDEIEHFEGQGFPLLVQIAFDPAEGGRLTVRDNAAGIHESDYARAFRPAEVPPDRAGLSEFGMGMKSAACWFAPQWAVRTSALGEPFEREVAFDIATIVKDDLEELVVTTAPANKNTHFTEITLTNLYKIPQTRTLSKIKEHLGSIYRIFIHEGLLVLKFDDQPLTYSQPNILVAPHYREPGSEPVQWRKEIDLDLGLGLRARGFAALRERGDVSRAGFALFRRNRLIQGSADEGYRPEQVFGKSNSYAFQRLFGELHLDGFDVSHTKDGFRWEENEEEFLALLKEELDSKPIRLLDQAEGYRSRPKPEEYRVGAETAVRRTADTIVREVPRILEQQLTAPPELKTPPPILMKTVTVAERIIDAEFQGCHWRIALELSSDPSIDEWVEISVQPAAQYDAKGEAIWRVGVRLALAHPFMERFGGTDAARIEPLLRVAVAVVLAEVTARASGVGGAGTIRRNINELLRDALSKA
ncbi:MAG: ATP-binding protein [Candidatus Hydrogenedentes bacterium]|nr:ATP-binding protein [Candidatus Hydrogenedentota bacterium]